MATQTTTTKDYRTPDNKAASLLSQVLTQTRFELLLTARRGESARQLKLAWFAFLDRRLRAGHNGADRRVRCGHLRRYPADH